MMIRIVALNDDSDSNQSNEDLITVTKEAEETIAASEYIRALEFKAKGKVEHALTLMRELLETRVLNEISLDDKNDKLLCIRYNCHKNIALILEEQGDDEGALEHYLQGMQYDDTEVYTMHRFGQLALKLKEFNLAQVAFQKCLNRNPNHWPSADGILQVLCGTENIMGAYGWALKWHMKDESYGRALDVLIEINEKFTDMIPFFENVWKHKFKRPDGRTCKGKKSMFPEPSKEIIVENNSLPNPNLDEFRIECLNWLTVGQYIISVYEHMDETKQSIIFLLDFDNLLKEKNVEDTKVILETLIKPDMEEVNGNSSENLNADIANEDLIENNFEDADDSLVFLTPTTNAGSKTPQPIDSNAEDSDNTKGEIETSKPKVRRRCSDLSFLEQWGWHKNRRYSSRKKSQQDRPENDTTLNGFLRRIFAKHFLMSFENDSPFILETKHESDSISKQGDVKSRIQHNQTTFEEFESKTKDDFDNFLAELKAQNVDLILIIFVWLKYVSKYWLQPITEEMKSIYFKLYNFYINHYDLATWNQLSNEDFNASYRMTLFFLELDHEKALLNSNELAKDLSAQWKMLFHHLKFNSGCAFVISDDIYEINMIRLIHLEYCWAKFENQISRSVDCLLHLESLLSKQVENFQLELPNLKDFNYVDLSSVRNTRIDLQRKISLSNVKTLYDNHQYQELIVILKDSLIYSTEVKNSDNTSMKIHTQFEVLLESLWNLEKYTDCLIWSERCFQHAVDNLIVAPTDTYRYEEWASCVNYILIYIEELILKDGHEIISCLSKYLCRLVQNLIRLLLHQLDTPFDKNNNPSHLVNIKRPWVILHQCLQRAEDNSPVVVKTKSLDMSENEDIEDLLPHSILTLFTAHEFLGRRQWCTRDNGQLLLYILDVILPKFRAPYMDAYRDIISEYLEQITYCLYGYPPKKARSRHIEEHDATLVELTWKRAVQLFDLYRPENLPEFNSYKLESISADMEQLLVKIINLIPKEIDPSAYSSNIRSFIAGSIDTVPQECNLLPHHISCIYYLLADYYFKNRDFTRTNKYYILDLTCKPNRYDSWAGIALSKASKLETKLNSFTAFDTNEFTKEVDQATRCFEQCIKLNKEQALIWIEFGSFTYFIHSYFSRDLKHSSDTLSMEQFAAVEERKDKHLSIAYNCFSISDNKYKAELHDEEDDDIEAHDEKWLNQYMLGKIAEKRKEHPKIYLDHYLLAANYLYENNATYPIKINHSNPTTLSVEALEMFYRTNAAIIKYIEQHNEIQRDIGNYFVQVLKSLAASPFAFNKAKVDDNSLNALKRKIADKAENMNFKQAKLDNNEAQDIKEINETGDLLKEASPNLATSSVENDNKTNGEKNISRSRSATPVISESCKPTSSSRRVSQESSVTTTTTSATETTSNTTSSSSGSGSSSSDSSSSDSDSSSSDESEKPDENTPFTESELEAIYKNCARNLEECVTRFPEHYKSVYRLVHHYLNGPEKLRDTTKCVQLLLGTYRTTLGNQINGLFFDRKNNNFFNGIWRLPSSEIDRPGSFSTHMVKCVSILSEVLRKTENHKLLIDVALQLQRNPDNDKRYIKDYERMDLYAQANSFCIQVMRDILKRNMEKRDDKELLNLLIDVYKTHKKCLKHMNQKDPVFTQLLSDVYKVYIQDKVVRMPENASILDLAIRLCLQEIAARKNQEKMALPHPTVAPNIPGVSDYMKPIPVTLPSTITSTVPSKPIQVAGVTARPRGRPVGSKNSIPSSTNSTPSLMNSLGSSLLDPASLAIYMSLFNNQKGPATKNSLDFQNLVAEYYKLLGVGSSTGISSVLPNLAAPSLGPIANPLKSMTAPKQAPAPLLSSNTQMGVSTANSTMCSSLSSAKIPQFDIKNLIASAASQASKFPNTLSSQSTTINIGSGELTITPTTSKILPKENTGNNLKNPLTMANPKQNSSSASISLTKVPTNSPNISVKPLSDLTGKPSSSFSQRSQLPELPKSLTITPASQSYYNDKYKSKQLPQNVVPPEINRQSSEKMNLKAKSSSKKSQNTTPYARPQSRTDMPSNIGSPSAISGAQLNPLNPLAQYSMIPGFNMDNYNQQASMLARYADLLKSMGTNTANPALLAQMSQMAQYPQFQMLSQKRPYTKKNKQQKNATKCPPPKVSTQTNIPLNRSTMPAHSTTGPHNYSNPGKPTFTQPFGIPSSLPSLSANLISPNLSLPLPNHYSHPNINPSPGSHTSPTKTLQQKLAEKQKANQLNEKNAGASGSNNSKNLNNGGKRGNIDVIILD